MPLGGLLPYGQPIERDDMLSSQGPFGPTPNTSMAPMGPPPGPFPNESVAPPQTPPSSAPFVQSRPPVNGEAMQRRMQMLMPAIVAAFGPKFGVGRTAALLTGMMRGMDARRARTEKTEETASRRASEAAKFQMDAINELTESTTPEELQAKMAALRDMAAFRGVDLERTFQAATGLVRTRQTEAATAKQKAEAAAVWEHNEKAQPGENWSSPHPDGEIDPQTGKVRQMPRDWWGQRGGKLGMLPARAAPVKPVPVNRNERLANPETGEVLLGTEEEPTKDFEWVTRGGQPLQIPKGTAKPGDRPYQPPSTAQGPQGSPQWVKDSAGALVYRVPRSGDSPYDEVAARQDGSGAAPSPYATERGRRTIESVNELIGKVSRFTTGFGSALAAIPETSARNFRAELDTLKANIAFNELTQMREASKTGGALGQVSNIELGLLQSALGALDVGQSPANLSEQLEKIRASVERWYNAQQRQAPVGGGLRGAGPGPAADPLGIR